MNAAATRRVLHAGSALLLLLAVIGSFELLRITLVLGAMLAVSLDSVRLRSSAFRALVTRLMPVFRPHEADALSGATWLAIGYALAVWFPNPAGVAGILAGAFSDPAASLAGSWLGNNTADKTWTGSCAAALTAAVVLLAVGIPLVAVVSGAIAASALERWPGPLNDNLIVAPGVALVVWLVA